MIRLRLLLTLSLLAFCSSILSAQDDELKVGLRLGHNAAFDGFAALSLETVQTIGQNITVSGGLQYNTIGKTALEVRPAYNMNFNWGNNHSIPLLRNVIFVTMHMQQLSFTVTPTI